MINKKVNFKSNISKYYDRMAFPKDMTWEVGTIVKSSNGDTKIVSYFKENGIDMIEYEVIGQPDRPQRQPRPQAQNNDNTITMAQISQMIQDQVDPLKEEIRELKEANSNLRAENQTLRNNTNITDDTPMTQDEIATLRAQMEQELREEVKRTLMEELREEAELEVREEIIGQLEQEYNSKLEQAIQQQVEQVVANNEAIQQAHNAVEQALNANNTLKAENEALKAEIQELRNKDIIEVLNKDNDFKELLLNLFDSSKNLNENCITDLEKKGKELYRKLSKKYHPDILNGNHLAFQKIQEVYESFKAKIKESYDRCNTISNRNNPF